MPDILQNIPENDPLRNPEQKKLIDQILKVNRDRPGATMVVLNELQKQIGFVSEAMQAYAAKELKVPVSSVHRSTANVLPAEVSR